MSLPDGRFPARMSRVALVAPAARLRARAGRARRRRAWPSSSGPLPAPQGEAVEALRRLERGRPEPGRAAAAVAARRPTCAELERGGARELLAGEVELARRAERAVHRGRFAALVGWVPADAAAGAARRLGRGRRGRRRAAPPGAGVEPPTLFAPGAVAGRFRPLVDTYGAPGTRDIDPTLFAAVSFVLMFGMMFGDAGHGACCCWRSGCCCGGALRAARRASGALWPFPSRAPGSPSASSGCSTARRSGPPGSCRRCGCHRSTSRSSCSPRRSPSVPCCSPSATASGSSTAGARAARALRPARARRASPALALFIGAGDGRGSASTGGRRGRGRRRRSSPWRACALLFGRLRRRRRPGGRRARAGAGRARSTPWSALGLERRLLHPARRVRAHARGAGRGGLDGARSLWGAARSRAVGGGGRLRRRQRGGVRARGAGGRGAGDAAGVLRALLARLRRRRASRSRPWRHARGRPGRSRP